MQASFSRRFLENVFVLNVVDHQCALAVLVGNHEISARSAWRGGDERYGAVVVLARRHRTAPATELEFQHAVPAFGADVAERGVEIVWRECSSNFWIGRNRELL